MGISSVNFEIYQFGNNTMTLRTYDKSVTIKMTKQTPSNVSAITVETTKDNKAYTINGMEATDTTKGIIIQNGKKTIRQ